jgi:hypothetical protein
VVEATGGSVTGFAVGDRVFGYCEGRFGAHAEYLTVAADSSVAAMPANASFVDAAPGTEGSHYALAYGRQRLHGQVTDWYYTHGDGMLLGWTTKPVYLTAEDNLIHPPDRIVPKQASKRLMTLEPPHSSMSSGASSRSLSPPSSARR